MLRITSRFRVIWTQHVMHAAVWTIKVRSMNKAIEELTKPQNLSDTIGHLTK